MLRQARSDQRRAHSVQTLCACAHTDTPTRPCNYCYCGIWCKSHAHPFGEPLIDQRITEVLRSITIDGKQTFLNGWMKKVLKDDYLCYDITSISSYSELNEYIKYGHNRDNEKLVNYKEELESGNAQFSNI
jgi:hypothetical protein